MRASPPPPPRAARAPWLLGIVLAAAALGAPASEYMDSKPRPPAEGEFEEPWREDDIRFPAFPRAENVVPLDAQRVGSGYSYFLDAASLSLGDDDVMRFTVILQSPEGASSIFYEGIRCATDEIKSYGYATRDRMFRAVADTRWVGVYAEGPLGYRTLLADHYVCDEHGWSDSVDHVLERLTRLDPRRPRVRPKPADANQ